MNNVEYIKQKLESQLNMYVFSDEEIETAISKVSGFRQEDKFVFGTAKNVGVNFFLATQIDEPDILSELFEKHEVKDWNQIRQITNKIKLFVFMNNTTEEHIEKEFNRILRDYPFYKFDSSKVENYVDYRLKENLHDLVHRNLLCRALMGDTDHYHDCLVGSQYLNLDDEQKAWHSLLFGFTYRAQFANLAIQLWPYPHTEKIEDIAEWCGKDYLGEGKFKYKDNDENGNPVLNNYPLIIVGKDCKYSKSKFPEFFYSVQQYSEGGNLYSKLKKAATVSEDRNENYLSLDREIRSNFQGIGRFMSFLVMQQLYAYFSWPINGNLCGLEEQGTWSCRIGQVAVMKGLDNMTEQELILSAGKSPSKELVTLMENHTKELLEELNSNLPFVTDVFEYESVQCEVLDKNLLKARELTSTWTSGEKSDIISTAYVNWRDNYVPTAKYPNAPDLKILFIPQIAKRPSWICDEWVDNDWFLTMNHCGLPLYHNYMLNDEVDVSSVLNLKSIEDSHNREMRRLVKELFSDEELDSIRKQYDPRLYLRWKSSIDKDSEYYQILNQEEKEFIDSLPRLHSEGKLYHDFCTVSK